MPFNLASLLISEIKVFIVLVNMLLSFLSPPDCSEVFKIAISRCQTVDSRKRPTFGELEEMFIDHPQQSVASMQ